MKVKKIISLFLCTCLLYSPFKAYAQDGPNLTSASSAESYVSLLDADGTPTDLFYSAGGVVSKSASVSGAHYEQSANTLYLSGFSTAQSLECSTMGDDFKIHLTGTNAIGQISVWGDGYGGSLTVEGNGTLTVNKALAYTDVPAVFLRADGAKASFSVKDSAKVVLNGTSSAGSLAILSTTVTEPLTAINANITGNKIVSNKNTDATYDYQISDTSMTLSANKSAVVKTAVTLKKTTIKTVSAKKKSITLKWKKIADASYYQVQISTDANFKKVTTKKTKAVSLTLTKLSRKKTYYIRVRSCKKVNGKVVTSEWSQKKKTKTK